MNYTTEGLLVVLSGCSGTGKNSVLQDLIQTHSELSYSVSATTRPPRTGEVNGRDYFFLSREEFLASRESGAFLEWAEVYGHYYGTPRRFIEEAMAARKDVVLDLDVQGALSIRAAKPGAVLVFLLPPSLESLRRRLVNRRTDTAQEIEKRLAAVDVEIQAIKSYDYVVVNDDIRAASEQIWSIMTAERCAVRRQEFVKILEGLHKEEDQG